MILRNVRIRYSEKYDNGDIENFLIVLQYGGNPQNGGYR